VGLMARSSKHRLEAAKRSILEGGSTSNRWELREWQIFSRELEDRFREQQRQMAVLQRIAFDHQTTLENLSDGLIYTNLEGRVVKHNPAAARLLRLPGRSVEGFSVRECLRHPEFLLWVDRLLKFQHPQELSLHSDELGQHLEIRGTELRAALRVF